MLPISEKFLLSPCEVRSMENTPILVGTIEKFVEDGIQIISREDKLPLIHCSTTVKVSVMNSALGFKILIGRVYLSTGEFLRVVDLQTAADYEKRNFFRVKVRLQTEAFPVQAVAEPPEPADPASTLPVKGPVKVRLRDISLSGIFLTTGYAMEIGDQLIVKLDLYGSTISLLCRVVRKIPVELGTEDGYGCEFLNSSGRQFDLLCRYLYDCQREQIQAMKEHARGSGGQ